MSTVDPKTLEKELEVMRELIRTDPEVLDHFDFNGDGKIDGPEWEAVHNLVVRRLTREAVERERAIAGMEGRPVASMEPLPERAPGEMAEHVFREDLVPFVQAPKHSGTNVEILGALLLPELILKRGGEFRGVSTECDVEYALFNRAQHQLCRLNLTRKKGRGVKKTGAFHVDIVNPDGSVTYGIRHTGTDDGFMIIEDVDNYELCRMERRSRWLGGRYVMTWPMGTAKVRRSYWDETAHVMIDDSGNSMGHVEQSWSGLGNLFDHDLMHIVFEPTTGLDARWAMLGAGVVFDVFRRR